MEHPGKIVYWDGNTNQIVHEAKVAEVPESLRFADGPNGAKIPVVKVVAFTEGNTREIHEYGPEGQLLRSTRQIKS